MTIRVRQLAILACAVVAFAACGADRAPSPAAGERVTVVDAGGSVTIPVADRDIWALDEPTALHLLALGVVSEHAARYPFRGDEITGAVSELLEDAGVELVAPDKLELVAAARPALIVGVNFPRHAATREQLERIAPVLLIDDTAAWDDQLRVLGAATGRHAAAATTIRRLDAAIDRLSRRVARSRHAGATVSVLSACGPELCAYGSGRTFGSILARLGFARPGPQAGLGNTWGFDTFSRELLDAHRGDVVIELVGSVDRGGAAVLDDPLLDLRGALASEVDFGAWYGSGVLNVMWILRDLEAILFDDGTTARGRDAPALWAAATR